ncbi:MAG: hypothetical protein Fur005_22880 [Roseiflexaceae bacterium]
MQRSTTRRDALLIFLTLLVSYLYVLPRWADWSQNSRLNLVRALVEQGTTRIDAYVANTGDYALYNDHTYTDKPPGLSFVGVPFYALALPIIDHPQVAPLLSKVAGGGALSGTMNESGSGLNTEKIRHFMAQAILTATTVAIPAAVLGVLIFWVLGLLGFERPIRLLATLGYGLATPAAAYAGNYYSHQFVAALLFGAFALLLAAQQAQPGTQRLKLGRARALLFGLLCGYALISEYPPAVIIATFGVFLLARVRPLDIGLAALGGIPPILLMMAYNQASFGTIWPVGYSHSALWQDQHHTGFMSITYPRIEALWGLLFGNFRGLFVRAPWLLLALPGFVIWWKSREQRGFWWISLFSVVALTLFYGSSIMWWGGFGIGPRYLVPMLPFLVIPACYALRPLWKSLAGRIVSIGLVLLSLLLTWAETLAGQSFPTDATRQPWFEITLPAWANGDIARNLGTAIGLDGAMSLVPLAVMLLLLVLFLLFDRQPPTLATRKTSTAADPRPNPTAS